MVFGKTGQPTQPGSVTLSNRPNKWPYINFPFSKYKSDKLFESTIM